MNSENHNNIENTNTLNPENNANSHVPTQYIISLKKFIILNIFSFGFYQLCWIFQAWRFFLQKDHLDIKIAARTGFSIFYLYPLFLRISNYALNQNKKYDLTSLLTYLAIVITCLLPNPLSHISILSFVFLIPAFKQLNNAKINDNQIMTLEKINFSIGDKILITLGSIVWIFLVFAIVFAILQKSS